MRQPAKRLGIGKATLADKLFKQGPLSSVEVDALVEGSEKRFKADPEGTPSQALKW
jgi:hypothetical protein